MHLYMTQSLTVVACASMFWFTACQSALGEEDALPKSTPTIEAGMAIQYLEIVTTDVDGVCSTLSDVHSIEFGASEPNFGNARLAILGNGGRLGVRAPLSEDEGAPVVRPYILVENIEAAIAEAEANGAEFAMLATEIPGHGKFAIYFQGGIQFGLWEK